MVKSAICSMAILAKLHKNVVLKPMLYRNKKTAVIYLPLQFTENSLFELK
jgi:hypothetical protein